MTAEPKNFTYSKDTFLRVFPQFQTAVKQGLHCEFNANEELTLAALYSYSEIKQAWILSWGLSVSNDRIELLPTSIDWVGQSGVKIWHDHDGEEHSTPWTRQDVLKAELNRMVEGSHSETSRDQIDTYYQFQEQKTRINTREVLRGFPPQLSDGGFQQWMSFNPDILPWDFETFFAEIAKNPEFAEFSENRLGAELTKYLTSFRKQILANPRDWDKEFATWLQRANYKPQSDLEATLLREHFVAAFAPKF